MTATAQATLDMLLGDFEDLWLAVAQSSVQHRGNCLFSHHIYTIWVWACRERSLSDLYDAFLSVDPRYKENFDLLRRITSDRFGPYENESVGFTGAASHPIDPDGSFDGHLTMKGSMLYVRTDKLYLDTKEALKRMGLC